MKYYLHRGLYFLHQIHVALNAINPEWLGHTCRKALENELPYDYGTGTNYTCMVYADVNGFDIDLQPEVLVEMFEH